MQDFSLANRLIEHIFSEELLLILGSPRPRREKSNIAEGHEQTARNKFNYVRSQMNMALIENARVAVALGCHHKSESPLNLLSPDLVRFIWGFVGMEKPAHPTAQARSGLAIVPFEGWRPDSEIQETEEKINLADTNLFKPGQKIIIPLTTPKLHVTAPCYRDLGKHIKAHAGWDIQRIVANPEQRTAHNVHRKGKAYFIDVIFTVPGQPTKRKRQRQSTTGLASEGLSQTQREQASSSLSIAVHSARIDGQIDPICLQRAVAAGYSKYFVLDKAAEYWAAVKNTTPQTKKARDRFLC